MAVDQGVLSFLQAVAAEAAAAGLTRVSVWDPQPPILAACRALPFSLELRDSIGGNIPCLRSKENLEGPVGEVEWLLREMYPWC